MQTAPAHERMARVQRVAAVLGCLAMFGCAQWNPSNAPASTPSEPSAAAIPGTDEDARVHRERGPVSMYGREFSGRRTASGATFDPSALTMAHLSLPFGTRVRVTNVENQRTVEVVVNDRGPYVAGRIADLSLAAAQRLGMVADGVVEAMLDIVSGPRP